MIAKEGGTNPGPFSLAVDLILSSNSTGPFSPPQNLHPMELWSRVQEIQKNSYTVSGETLLMIGTVK